VCGRVRPVGEGKVPGGLEGVARQRQRLRDTQRNSYTGYEGESQVMSDRHSKVKLFDDQILDHQAPRHQPRVSNRQVPYTRSYQRDSTLES